MTHHVGKSSREELVSKFGKRLKLEARTMTPQMFKLDGSPCQGYRFEPGPHGSPKGVLHIVHGAAEHSLRYTRLAEAVSKDGWIVYAHDHRGHGKTPGPSNDLGHFADKDGWSLAIQDLAAFLRFDRSQHPELPLVVFGHSMGSFIVQDYVFGNAAEGLTGVILSGTNGRPPLLAQLGLWIARFERWRQGPKGRSDLLQKMGFSSFNQQFKPNRTSADWLSRDPDEVDKYVSDPYCGFSLTNQLWIDMLQALPELASLYRLRQVPSDLPVFIFGGEKDPVGQHGKGLLNLVQTLKAAGMTQVAHKIYRDGRHEMLNEVNRHEVMDDIADWLKSQVQR